MNYDVERTANILKDMRKGKKISQETAANDMGINIKTYQAAEQGKRGVTIDTLCLIAGFYGVSLDYLITGIPGESKWIALTKKLTTEQNQQLFLIASGTAHTLGWV